MQVVGCIHWFIYEWTAANEFAPGWKIEMASHWWDAEIRWLLRKQPIVASSESTLHQLNKAGEEVEGLHLYAFMRMNYDPILVRLTSCHGDLILFDWSICVYSIAHTVNMSATKNWSI